LRRTVGQLLDATRIESGLLQPALEWCAPSELVADAIRLCECADDQIVVKVTAPVPNVRVDGGLIAQALAILIHNALTHGASREKPEISVRESTGWIEFLVSDSGPGLPEGSEIFAKFVRGPRAPAGGVGLGLSIARHLAEIHGGSLNAWNRKAAGALFTLRIPTGGTMKIPE
jgi:K+-sensing histidine kinase KdpD